MQAERHALRHAQYGTKQKNTYAYRVRAFNGAGHSGYSNTASGKPQ